MAFPLKKKLCDKQTPFRGESMKKKSKKIEIVQVLNLDHAYQFAELDEQGSTETHSLVKFPNETFEYVEKKDIASKIIFEFE